MPYTNSDECINLKKFARNPGVKTLEMKSIKIGLIGFGTVGTGVVRLLTEQRELLARRLGTPWS